MTERVLVGDIRQPSVEERFWSKVDKAGDCWEWTAYVYPNGYGQFSFSRSRHLYAHRVSYMLNIGPIPDGLQIDHLCRNRSCVNPAHLEAVTGRTNVLRSPIAPSAVNARKTHCPQGHPYSHKNTYIDRSRTRHCRTCDRLRKRARQREGQVA